MTSPDKEMMERATKVYEALEDLHPDTGSFYHIEIIAAELQAVRDEALEQAAKVAQNMEPHEERNIEVQTAEIIMRHLIMNAIRALKGKP